VLTQEMVGGKIELEVSWIDGQGGAERLVSTPTATITNTNNAPTLNSAAFSLVRDGSSTNTGSVSLESASWLATSSPLSIYYPRVGDALALTLGITDPDNRSGSNATGAVAAQSLAFQWFADNTPIPGATASTLSLSDAVAGKSISVTVQYSDAFGAAESVTLPASVPVGRKISAGQSTGFTESGTAGVDLFVATNGKANFFLVKANQGTQAVDQVDSFSTADGDMLWIELSSFGVTSSLPSGVLAANSFVDRSANSAAALPSAACFYYTISSGKGLLWYDPDGSGSQSAVLLVELLGAPAITELNVGI
jgi:hypothetical protein